MEETVLVVSLQSDIKSHNLAASKKQLVVLSVTMVTRPFIPSQVLKILPLLQIG
jgi:hypothetical protein